MPLAAGTRLGPYEILAPLGAGGMGEVYQARDTRLDRTVAIKLLPAAISGDPNRRARLEREAKTIAALSHPHICTLHDVGEHDGSIFLVMERLEGQTLAARLANGPLSSAQALTIAIEISDALAAAHRRGVIHRDLKPSNVMLTRSGAKLLDFGLAKLTDRATPTGSLASAPTHSTTLTADGVIAGTLHYMSPEQLEGKPADARSDLWAVGAIIYEMVTGKRAFEAGSAVGVIGAILEREPTPVAVLQPLIPPAVDNIVRQCLAKSPDDRPDTAHDLASQLRWIREASGAAAAVSVRGGARRHWFRPALAVTAAVVVTAAITSWLWARWRPVASVPAVVRSELSVAPAEELNAGTNTGWAWMPAAGGAHTAFAWTPDGRTLLFVGRRDGVHRIYARPLDQMEARALAGTDGAKALAVSPDGLWVAFWADRVLKRVPIAGGPVVEVLRGMNTPPMGLSWDTRGNVYFGNVHDRSVWRVSADGAATKATTAGDANWADILPWPLPGGDVLLHTVRKREWSWGDEEIVAVRLASGERKTVLRDAADARYLSTGHLVFLRRGVLFAVPFDTGRLEVRGTPQALVEDVAQALTAFDSNDVTGAGQFAVAPTGTLAWVRGPVVRYPGQAMVSLDRQGRVTRLRAPEKSYVMGVRLAPGGRRLAAAVRDLGEVSIWTYDLDRGTAAPLPGARGGEAYLHVWTRDGERLLFHWLKDGRPSLAFQRADGTAGPQVLDVGAGTSPSSWTADGRLIVVTYGGDLAMVTFESGRPALRALTQTPHAEAWPEVSPDSRWLAYASNDSGRFEVYVQPFPGAGARTQVSIGGGESPAWHPDGRALFFIGASDAAGKRQMKMATFEPDPPVRIGAAKVLFQFDPTVLKLFCGTIRCYDVSPDGQRFYAVQTPEAPPQSMVKQITLVQNWFGELQARVPAR